MSGGADIASEAPAPRSTRFDLLRAPLLGRFLRWRHARTALQIPLMALAVVVVLDGFLGASLAPKNLATVATWVHYRGLLVLVLLAAGNLFCMACPFMLPRNLARRFVSPPLRWPKALRNKLPAVVLLVAVLYAYELFDLWADPVATAGLIAGYFAAALLVDLLFRHASFCKYVCPIGQFNFLASTVSPLEVRVRDAQVCARCHTKDCIRGRAPALVAIADPPRASVAPADPRGALRGCELLLFQPRKVGNLDCTFCLDCVHACPYDNVGIRARLPASELFDDPSRSGIGRLSQRGDVAVLALVFTFGALLHAFAMVSPVYALETWLARVMGVGHEAPVLGVLFGLVLVVEPALLLGSTAAWSRRWANSDGGIVALAARHATALVPFGFGVWLSHYGFHFLTGFATIVPLLQSRLADRGWPVLGAPDWRLAGLSPAAALPIELGLLGLGAVASLVVLARRAAGERPERPHAVFVPWAVLLVALTAAAVWVLLQPMEMRGTMIHG